MTDRPSEFPGYEILRELGRGGMGVVHLARDLRRGEVVALKTLIHADPGALDRFKREFRSLADLALPNVVGLHELVSDGERWFFTMEYVEGVPFTQWVRGRAGEGADRERLRSALGQLAEALSALHGAGMLHRDVKPSNVLVTHAGRVVVLDFGLVAALGQAGVHESTQALMLGTVEYMSPEQAIGGEVSAASDWYCVGAMLYEALTGRIPFTGAPLQVLIDKQSATPASPRDLDPTVPEDLDALCVDLLRPDAAARPSGKEVLRRLAHVASGTAPAAAPARATLLGRERETEALADAFREAKGGRTVVAHVHGHSGMGKSALVESFLAGLVERGEAVVLSGRCYARESVPYKALDSAIDALARHLDGLDRAEVAALLPRDVPWLARVFPTLRRVEAIARAPERAGEVLDPQEVRRRAFSALREMLARISDRRPLVLHVDDAQWGDADSAAVLADVLRPPDAPALLLLLSYRTEDRAESPFLRGLETPSGRPEASSDRREVAIGALAPDDARRLARSLLDGDPGPAEAIAAESRGNPYFLGELAQHVRAGGALGASGAVTLEGVLLARAERLAERPKRLLEVVAVAGVPVLEDQACAAASAGEARWEATATLRAGHWIRTLGLDREPRVDTYHDRIRETVVAHLPAETSRAHHLHLGEALEASERADPELVAIHFQQAGEPRRAGAWFARAAERASDALAFDRAARLYRLALELAPPEGDEKRAMLRRLADALTSARRGGEAAQAYLAAAEGAPEADAFELRCRAANQLLVSGRLDEWTRLAGPLLAALGLGRPRSPLRVLLSLLARRLHLRLRGYGYKERAAAEIPPRELVRVDIVFATSTPLAYVDPVWAMELSARQVLLALRAGEPGRVARALAGEAASSSSAGSRATERTWEIWKKARSLAERTQDPHALGMTSLTGGWASNCEGRWRDVVRFMDDAETVLRERCTGVAWELNTAAFFRLRALECLGRIDEVCRLLPVALDEAEGRNDLYAVTNLRTRIAYLDRLAHDAPDEAVAAIDRGIASWPAKPFRLQHVYETQARVDVAHYVGDPRPAWELLEQRWRASKRAHFLRVQIVRAWLVMLRARTATALAATDAGERERWLRAAEADARRLEGEGAAWCLPFVPLFRGAAGALRGDGAGAGALFAEAETGFGAVEMPLQAAAARRRRGLLLGGDEGRALVASAESVFSAAGIRAPARWAAMIAP